MRTRSILAGLAAVALASPAGAQETPAPAAPAFLNAPGVQDITEIYPKRALAEDVSGRVTLRCEVEADGALSNCAVVAEAPAGYGFGQAALRLTPRYRLDPARPSPTGTIQFTLGFSTS